MSSAPVIVGGLLSFLFEEGVNKRDDWVGSCTIHLDVFYGLISGNVTSGLCKTFDPIRCIF